MKSENLTESKRDMSRSSVQVVPVNGGVDEKRQRSSSDASEPEYDLDGDNGAIISQAISNVRLSDEGGNYDGRKGKFGSSQQNGVLPLLKSKFLNTATFGSRMVGGHKPANLEAYKTFESVSYIVPDTAEQEARFVSMDKKKRSLQRLCMWFRYGFVGLIVSLFVAGGLRICKIIEKARVKQTGYLLDADDVAGAWLFWTGTSVGMNLVAVLLVLVQPAAASSGIPGLISYLNGVKPSGGKSPITKKMTSFTSVKTMIAKSAGMLCSIPSGLCIGPEGPIIHISALLAYHATNLVHHFEEKLMGKEFDVSSENECRDFLATGAACGITTAFRAPLAGTLFVVEEAGSFFTTQHLEYTFFACLVAYWVQWVLGLSMDGEEATGAKFGQTTGYFCNVDNPLNMLAYMVMAILGGCLGAAFNQIVEKLNHIRAHEINHHGWARVLEVVFLALLTGTAVVLLPLGSSCRKATRDIMLHDSAGCLPLEDFKQLSHGHINSDYLSRIVDSASLHTANTTIDANSSHGMLLNNLAAVIDRFGENLGNYSSVWNEVYLDNGAPYIHVHYEHTYTCGKKKHEFNDMAMLWLNGGVKGVKVLMQRGFPHLISTTTLWLFLCAYFTLASISAGTHVPAGLVVPLLLVGGSFGRLFGVYWMNFKTSLCSNYDTIQDLSSSPTNMMNYGMHPDAWPNYNMYYWSSIYRWIIRDCKLPDPGSFAVIGMASFMGGSGRITVMLAIVMLELTGDAGMIAPVGIVCVLAMLVGNLFNHGLYHGLIPVMNIPFLNSVPSHVMFVTRVVSVMSKDLHYIPKMVSPHELRVLKYRMSLDHGNPVYLSHNGFPVVRGDYDMNLVGLLDKDQLLRALKDVDDPRRSHLCLWKNGKLDLTMYCERSPLSVLKTTTVSRAYEIFRKLGLRHLVVCGNNGKVEGMITRKDLMVFRIVQQKKRELGLIVKMQDTYRLKLKARGFYNHLEANPRRSKSHAKRMDKHLKIMMKRTSLHEAHFLSGDPRQHFEL